MADIAAVFHWPLSDMLAMDLLDLLQWRRRAVSRWKSMNKVKSST